MSKERKFHELIEQQNREEKNHVWEKICEREAEQKAEPVLPKARSFHWKKWGTIAAASLTVVFLGVFAVVKFFPFGDVTPDNSGRYFTNQSYEVVDTSTNMQGYAQQIEKDLLYFDWYEETDYCKNQEWKLKNTGEIICFSEEMVDINTGCVVYLFITESNTKLEDFSSYESVDLKTQMRGINIQWRSNVDKAWANFEYEGYRYYLRIKEPIDENYVLSLVEELLS